MKAGHGSDSGKQEYIVDWHGSKEDKLVAWAFLI